MKQHTLILSASICLALMGNACLTSALAGEPVSAPAKSARPVGNSLSTMSDAQAETLSPLNREMRNILLLARADVEALTARMATINNRLAVLDVQREIGDRKARSQIDLLAVQGRYAHQEGRIEQADEADAAVIRLKALLKARQDSRRVEREEG